MRSWIAEPAAPTALKDEMLIRVQAASRHDVPALVGTLRTWRSQRAARLAGYEKLRARIHAGRPEAEYLSTTNRPGGYLTLLRGIAFERENVAWADDVERVLSSRAG